MVQYRFGRKAADAIVSPPGAVTNPSHYYIAILGATSGYAYDSPDVSTGVQYATGAFMGTYPVQTDTTDGFIMPFQGPDGIPVLWIDFNAGMGPRYPVMTWEQWAPAIVTPELFFPPGYDDTTAINMAIQSGAYMVQLADRTYQVTGLIDMSMNPGTKIVGHRAPVDAPGSTTQCSEIKYVGSGSIATLLQMGRDTQLENVRVNGNGLATTVVSVPSNAVDATHINVAVLGGTTACAVTPGTFRSFGSRYSADPNGSMTRALFLDTATFDARLIDVIIDAGSLSGLDAGGGDLRVIGGIFNDAGCKTTTTLVSLSGHGYEFIGGLVGGLPDGTKASSGKSLRMSLGEVGVIAGTKFNYPSLGDASGTIPCIQIATAQDGLRIIGCEFAGTAATDPSPSLVNYIFHLASGSAPVGAIVDSCVFRDYLTTVTDMQFAIHGSNWIARSHSSDPSVPAVWPTRHASATLQSISNTMGIKTLVSAPVFGSTFYSVGIAGSGYAQGAALRVRARFTANNGLMTDAHVALALQYVNMSGTGTAVTLATCNVKVSAGAVRAQYDVSGFVSAQGAPSGTAPVLGSIFCSIAGAQPVGDVATPVTQACDTIHDGVLYLLFAFDTSDMSVNASVTFATLDLIGD